MSSCKQSKSGVLLGKIRDGNPMSTSQLISLVARLSIPAIMAQISSIIMQYIDAAMVGHLGAQASASIGLVSSTTWLFGNLAVSAAVGFYVQVAQLIGAKDNEGARSVLRQSIVVVAVWSILLALLGAGISTGLPQWLGGDMAIRDNAMWYFLIYACSLPFIAINALAGGMLQCSGNMKMPSILNAAMCLLDVVFNWIFIFDEHTIAIGKIAIRIPGAGLGVKGAALGTAVSVVVISIVMLTYLCCKSPMLRIHIGESFRPVKACLKKAVKIALPVGFEHFVVCAAMIITTRIVAPLGVVAIAANSFAITAESICYMPGYGIGDAATTLVGQSVGAGRHDLTRKLSRLSTYLGMIVMTVFGAVMYIAAPAMIGMLTPDMQVRELAVRILRIEAFAEPMYAASIVVSGALRGAGDTLIPSIMNFVSLWAVRIPLALVLSRYFGLVGVWIAMCSELVFRGIIFLVRLFTGGKHVRF